MRLEKLYCDFGSVELLHRDVDALNLSKGGAFEPSVAAFYVWWSFQGFYCSGRRSFEMVGAGESRSECYSGKYSLE